MATRSRPKPPSDDASSAPPVRRAIVRLAPQQASLAAKVAQLAGLEYIAAGGPDANGRGASDLGARELGAPHTQDFRGAMTSGDAEVAVVLSASGADSPLDDPELLRVVADRGMRIVSLEPAPASLLDLPKFEKAEGAHELVRVAPSTRRVFTYGAAIDLLESIGPVRTLAVSQRSGAGEGTLAARLFDAMHTVFAILGEPETIDASIIGPLAPGRVHLAPGSTLREARGDMTANLRFARAASASVTLSDAAGRWFRGVTIVGHGGCLRFDDTGLECIDAAGKTVDRAGPKRAAESPDLCAQLVATEILAMFDPRSPRPEPTPRAVVLAMCESALLSARTGQPESPATVLRMAGAV